MSEATYINEGNKYLHLPGLIMTESDTGEVRYLLSDGLGSIRHAVDATGTVVAYREYSPYGEPVAGAESGYGYTGEWWESEVGLLHLRARWYSPEHGVFLSRDPFEGTVIIPQSLNGYNYVHQNPINWTDPSGETMELDLVLLNSDELVVIEVKSLFSQAEVVEFLADLQKFQQFFPEYRDYRVYGAIAGLEIPTAVGRYAYRQGLFVVVVSGQGLVEMRNDTKFKPKNFGATV